MIDLFDACTEPPAAAGGPGFFRQWRLVGIDGTTLDIPDTTANERTYGRPGTNTEAKRAYPQARVLGLVECGTHAALGTVVSEYDTAEQPMYPGLLRKLEADMPAIADRGFFRCEACKESSPTGAQLWWRMKGNAVLPVHGVLTDGSYLAAVHEGTTQRRHNTDPIPVLVIEYTVATGKEKEAFRLVTTILDSAGELAARPPFPLKNTQNPWSCSPWKSCMNCCLRDYFASLLTLGKV